MRKRYIRVVGRTLFSVGIMAGEVLLSCGQPQLREELQCLDPLWCLRDKLLGDVSRSRAVALNVNGHDGNGKAAERILEAVVTMLKVRR